MIKEDQEKIQLQEKIKELQEVLQMNERLSFALDSPTPKGGTARKKYVSDIALFYASVFKEKLEHFKGLQLEELAQIGRTELSTNIIRANINAFRLIGEWMEKMTNEHFGNVENARANVGENQNIINEFKDKYEN